MGYSKTRVLDPVGGALCHYANGNRYWNVQAPPFRTPLEYQFERTINMSFTSTNPACPTLAGEGLVDGPQLAADAASKCYDSFNNALGDPSQWANNLLEAGESLNTVVSRIGQITSFVGKLRKRDFYGAAKVLKMPPSEEKHAAGGARHAKGFGNQFLEYHFGWQPAIDDIGNAVNVLQSSDFGTRKVVGHGRSFQSNTSHTRTDDTDFFSQYDARSTYTASCKSGARVRISNPNAFLANRLGFVNPLSVAWEAVPYSFVVDWFTNVGQVLSSMTDWIGLYMEDPYTTAAMEGDDYYHAQRSYRGDFSQEESTNHYMFIHRVYGVTRPSLYIKPFSGFSLVRGVTAVSLLLQKL